VKAERRYPDGEVASRPLLETGSGSRPEAFGPRQWLLLTGIALIWGSSFLFIDLGLEALEPGVITLARVALGVMALALIPAARRPVLRQDRLRVAFLGVIWAGLPMLLFPVAQQWIDSSVAGMLNGAVPLAGAAWAVLLAGRCRGSTSSGCWSALPGSWPSSGPSWTGRGQPRSGPAWWCWPCCCTGWPSTWRWAQEWPSC
jgi:drug/metabolite transporter (DMT)-like permease